MKLEMINKRINQMSTREKVLLVLTIAAVACMLLDITLLKPIETKRRALSSKIDSFQQQTAEMGQRLSYLGSHSGQSGKLSKLDELKAEEVLVAQQLQAHKGRLPQSDRSLSVLHTLAYPKQPDVRLVALKNIPRESLQHRSALEAQKSAATEGGAVGGAGNVVEAGDAVEADRRGVDWYRHGLVVKVLGPFPQLVEYIKSLERASWKMVWETLYVVREVEGGQQRTEMTFELYTMTDQPDWLEVRAHDG